MTKAQKLRFDAERNGFDKDPSQVDVMMAGLYLGEGAKTQGWTMVNSDPNAIKLTVAWFASNYATISWVKVNVHHLNTRSKEEISDYWSKITGFPTIKVYRCKSTPSSSKNPSKKAVSNYGVCYISPKKSVYFAWFWRGQFRKVVHQVGLAPT